MKLEAWLRQNHTLAERLRLVERLSQALNAVHDSGEVLASLEPGRIELGNDLKCDLSAARRGTPEPGYAPQERLEGGPPSQAADIYAAGAICWEVLVGRPCGELPAPLSEVAPSLSTELAGAIMGCLERSPQWRPKDLTYLAQLAAAQQKPASRSGKTPDRPPAPSRAVPQRTPPRRTSQSHLPLALAALAVIAAAAGSYWWIQRQGSTGTAGAATRAVPRPGPATSTNPEPAPPETSPSAEPTPLPAPEPRDGSPASVPAPTPEPTPLLPAPAPLPTPTPAVRAPLPPEPIPTPTPTPTPAPVPPPTAPAAPREAAQPAPPPGVAREPPTLTTLSPLSVRRPGKILLDLHGSALRSDLRARVLPLREVPRGITVAGQKWVSADLVTVLLELDASVAPGAYAIALEDAEGAQTKPLQFTVTR